MKPFKDIKNAFYIVWFLSAVITSIIILLTFFADKDFLLSAAPGCVYKTALGTECISCGMTKAFIDISSGNIASASENNKFGIFLYGMFILNFVFFASFSLKKILLKKL